MITYLQQMIQVQRKESDGMVRADGPKSVTGISQDRVIQELARIAFVNPQNVINPKDASVKADATEDDLACIQSVKVKTMDGAKGKSVEREVRLNDKMKALELLGKHLGMFKDKLEVDADMDLNITIDYGDNDNEES